MHRPQTLDEAASLIQQNIDLQGKPATKVSFYETNAVASATEQIANMSVEEKPPQDYRKHRSTSRDRNRSRSPSNNFRRQYNRPNMSRSRSPFNSRSSSRYRSHSPHRPWVPRPSNQSQFTRQFNHSRRGGRGGSRPSAPSPCLYCGKPGHFMQQCFSWKRDRGLPTQHNAVQNFNPAQNLTQQSQQNFH